MYEQTDYTFVWILLVTLWLSFAGFTAWLAGQKGHDKVKWGMLGFLFTFIALAAIGFAPVRQPSARPVQPRRMQQPLGPAAQR